MHARSSAAPRVFPALALSLAACLGACSVFKTDVDKAREFTKAQMYPQATTLLTKAIDRAPTDADAHFLLGACYLNTGQAASGEEEFRRAVSLKADYGKGIGGEFLRAANYSLTQPQLRSSAPQLFLKAVEYDPSLRQQVANTLFVEGGDYGNKAQPDEMNARMAIAASLDPGIRNKICDEYYKLGNAASGSATFGFYQSTQQYCRTHDQAIGQRLLQMSKDLPSPSQAAEYLREASRYVDQDVIFDATASTFILESGKAQGTITHPDKTTVMFRSTKEFSILEGQGQRPDGSYILVPIRMPAGKSSRFFLFGGRLMVQGIHNGTELRVSCQ